MTSLWTTASAATWRIMPSLALALVLVFLLGGPAIATASMQNLEDSTASAPSVAPAQTTPPESAKPAPPSPRPFAHAPT